MSSVGSVFGIAVHHIPTADERLVLPFAKIGVEVEVENCTIAVGRNTIAGWNPHRDDSLRNNGMEFTTNGGMVGKALITSIETFCAAAVKHKFSEGYPRAGIHLHIDVTDLNENNNTEFLHCVLAYIMFEKALFKFAGEWREACGFSDPLRLSQHDFAAISKLLYGWEKINKPLSERQFSKYQALNFLPMSSLGTIEFRHLPTTFDSKRILDWVNICASFKKYGKEINRDPVEYLEENGLDGLIDAVFGKCANVIGPFIDKEDVLSAIADVRALRVLNKSNWPADPWTDPDSPLIASKLAAMKGLSKAKRPAAAPRVRVIPENLQLPRVAANAVGARADIQWRIIEANVMNNILDEEF